MLYFRKECAAENETENLPCGCRVPVGFNTCRYHRAGSDLSATARKTLENSNRKSRQKQANPD
jgi:hypothetical protein